MTGEMLLRLVADLLDDLGHASVRQAQLDRARDARLAALEVRVERLATLHDALAADFAGLGPAGERGARP